MTFCSIYRLVFQLMNIKYCNTIYIFMKFAGYDVCRLITFVAYEVCRIMTFVAYRV